MRKFALHLGVTITALVIFATPSAATEPFASPEPVQTVQVALSEVATTLAPMFAATGTPGAPAVEPKTCSSSTEVALFGVNGRYEDYLRLCFPCCFCCDAGSCCDECKKNNKLTAAQPQTRN
jgi:hypothetical protein